MTPRGALALALLSAAPLACGVKAPPRPPLPEPPPAAAAPASKPAATAPEDANAKKKAAKPTTDAGSR
jgi:hypothetical protein